MTEDCTSLLAQLKDAYQGLEEFRSSSVEEHERVLCWAEETRGCIQQHGEAALVVVHEELAALTQQLKDLTQANQTSLQEGVARIQVKQGQISALSCELQALVSRGGETGGADVHRQVAEILSPENRFVILLKRPRFVPRLPRSPKLGEIICEDRPTHSSAPSPSLGAEANGTLAAEELSGDSAMQVGTNSQQTTFTRTLHINCTSLRRGDQKPTLTEGSTVGDATGVPLLNRKESKGHVETTLGAENKTPTKMNNDVTSPSPYVGKTVGGAPGLVGLPAREGCAWIQSPCPTERGDIPASQLGTDPAADPSPNGITGAMRRDSALSIQWEQASNSTDPSTAPCLQAQASGSPQGNPPVDSAPMGASHPEGEEVPTIALATSGSASKLSTTWVHQKTSVHTTNLHQPFLQVRSHHRTETAKPNGGKDHLTENSLPRSQTPLPSDCGSIFRATAVFISDEDSDEKVGAADTNHRRLEGVPRPPQSPALTQPPCAWQGINSPTTSRWRSETSSRSLAEKGCSGNSARGRRASSARRFKRKEFSKSCLDLSNTKGPELQQRPWECPEQTDLTQRSSSFDSTETFFIDSPRGLGERKEGGVMTASRVQERPRSAAHQNKPQINRTSRRAVHGGDPSGTEKGRSQRAHSGGHSHSEPQQRMKSPGQRMPFQPKSVVKGDSKVSSPKGSGSHSGSELRLGSHRASSEEHRRHKVPTANSPTVAPLFSLRTSKARSRSEANLSQAWHRVGPFYRNDLVGQFGKYGSGWGDLNLPYGVHASAPGTLYVVDYGNRRLQVVDRTGDTVQQLRLDRGIYFDVAVNSDGLVALTSISHRSVDVYNSHGQLLNVITGTFQNPRGITVNSQDQFLITDTKQGTVSVLILDAETGQAQGSDAVPGFHKPYFISANRGGRVAVSERAFDGGCCVKVLDSDLRLLTVLGDGSSGFTVQLSNPWGVCIDGQDNVLVADWGRRHSLVLFPAQGPACVLVENGLSSPRGLALPRDGHVAVVDSMHNCIKVFHYR
ncbi:uncharacterized protein LOC132390987 [Hypanus sabinus]|uniref:uncharacterized protein LOC132390987 n=1 Tax=Hypanus sabinus TaxID=79690 RepID=UPI0028C42059|nr:uncharacterized protein LOC132390987 [Hypanus sabinus]